MKRRTAFGHQRALDTAVSLLYHLSPTARGRRYSKDLLPWLSREPERNFWKLTILVVCTLITHYYDLSYINVLKLVYRSRAVYYLCVVQIYLQLRNIQSRDSKTANDIWCAGGISLLAFWTQQNDEPHSATDAHWTLPFLFCIIYRLQPETEDTQKTFCRGCPESEKDISGNQQYQQFVL
ncbi:Hypothetical_protein [Hexamita inflata]|uniref:Hypothetical_protein n=1 Tax=Hexamita inflata TaxID=28002 RepID=A0AA86P7J5_9EUKA|nr:Hypothetical protein HINF_LOCUS20788 [Hexamita inflata]